MKRISARHILILLLTGLAIAVISGCGDNEIQPYTVPMRAHTATTTSTPGAAPSAGIAVDPNLQSVTGTPTPDEMKEFIALQGKVPYPVLVPTQLPGGYQLDAGVIGSSSPTAKDPSGYYSYRYFDPSNPNRTLTFNQSRSNSKPLSGYYLTEEWINGVQYNVYWHRTREYLPNGDPVRTTAITDAEVFIVVWQGQYTDTAGQPQDLWYSLSTGTWTGHGWGDIEAIIAGLKPVSGVGS